MALFVGFVLGVLVQSLLSVLFLFRAINRRDWL